MARKLLSADGSQLTFRKSRTLPGKHIGCDEPRPKGLFFFAQKELNYQCEALKNDCHEKAFEADELEEYMSPQLMHKPD
ncbi:hypothetical protein [Staphylococcus nepalensis]|uniref:hypothetical protein n=2 Tax=Staphylococcus nepalensis TaxID=214473 RepID=UPI0030159B42